MDKTHSVMYDLAQHVTLMRHNNKFQIANNIKICICSRPCSLLHTRTWENGSKGSGSGLGKFYGFVVNGLNRLDWGLL